MIAPRRWLAALGVATSLAGIATALPSSIGLGALVPDPSIRFVVLLAFVATAPGTAILGLLEPERRELAAAAVLAVGLAAGAVLAQLLLVAHAWRPAGALLAAALACLAALAVSEIRHGRRAAPEPTP